jgi:hypothetical protein
MTQSRTVTTYPGWLDTGNPQLVTPDPSGDAGSGRYHATVVIPVGAVAGVWDANVDAADQATNATQESTTVNVADSNPIDTTEVPQMIDGQVTTTTAPSTLTVTLHLQSIRDEASVVAVGVTDPAMGSFDLNLSSGTDTDGTWQVTLHTSASDIGNWSVNDVAVMDRFGIWHDLPAGDLANITGRSYTIS